MQLIFFVPPNEELEGTLHPKKLDVPPKMKVKGTCTPDEKTCGHAALNPMFISGPNPFPCTSYSHMACDGTTSNYKVPVHNRTRTQ
jgi:hypothetical protein